MPRPTKKVYQLYEPNVATLRANRTEYGLPEIRLGAVSDGGYWVNIGTLKYQFTVDGTEENGQADQRTYGGHVECDIHNVQEVAKIVGKARVTGHELAPVEGDQMKVMLVGLRAIGYRRANVHQGKVTSTS